MSGEIYEIYNDSIIDKTIKALAGMEWMGEDNSLKNITT